MNWFSIKWKIKDFFNSWKPGNHTIIYIGVDYQIDNKWHNYRASLDALNLEPDYTVGFPRRFLVFNLKAEINDENNV